MKTICFYYLCRRYYEPKYHATHFFYYLSRLGSD